MPETDRRTRYLPRTTPPILLFLLLWILISSIPPLLMTGDFVPLDLFPQGMIHQLVLSGQLSYLIFGLPLLVSGFRSPEMGTDGAGHSVDQYRFVRYLLFAIVLVALGLPAFLVAGKIAGVQGPYLVQGPIQVCSLVLGIGLIWWGAGRGRTCWVPPLFVGLLVMTVISPLTYAGLAQVGGVEYPFLLDVSPVVSAFRDEPVMDVSPRTFHAFLSIGSGVIFGTVLWLRRTYYASVPDGRA